MLGLPPDPHRYHQKSCGHHHSAYDAANRLVALADGEASYIYAYNGLGDRVSQSVDGVTETYQLDLNAGLTQVLSDGANIYLYGQGRIAQEAGEIMGYLLPDGLGSVRTVLEGEEVLLAQDYTPYGEVLANTGSGASAYGFAGEWTDASGMQYLRARYYDPAVGRFVSRDGWEGIYAYPSSLNRWMYVNGNPINLTDPSGMCYYDFNGDGRCDGEDIKLAVFVGSAQIFVAYHSRAQIESDFMTGAVSEGLRNISWFIPPAQEALEASLCYENESMLMGRLTVDVLSVIGGGMGVGGGTAITGGGVVSCGTGVLCLAGAPATAVGAVLAAEGAGVMSAGITNFGDNISRFQQVNNEWNNSHGWKKLSESEIKILKKKGIDIHDLKGERHVGQWDLFKDANGNIYIKPKNGIGPGDPTGLNINDFLN